MNILFVTITLILWEGGEGAGSEEAGHNVRTNHKKEQKHKCGLWLLLSPAPSLASCCLHSTSPAAGTWDESFETEREGVCSAGHWSRRQELQVICWYTEPPWGACPQRRTYWSSQSLPGPQGSAYLNRNAQQSKLTQLRLRDRGGTMTMTMSVYLACGPRWWYSIHKQWWWAGHVSGSCVRLGWCRLLLDSYDPTRRPVNTQATEFVGGVGQGWRGWKCFCPPRGGGAWQKMIEKYWLNITKYSLNVMRRKSEQTSHFLTKTFDTFLELCNRFWCREISLFSFFLNWENIWKELSTQAGLITVPHISR